MRRTFMPAGRKPRGCHDGLGGEGEILWALYPPDGYRAPVTSFNAAKKARLRGVPMRQSMGGFW